MTKTEFKGLMIEAFTQAMMQLQSAGVLPLGFYPKVHAMCADELTVDRIMEEDDKEVFFLKVTL